MPATSEGPASPRRLASAARWTVGALGATLVSAAALADGRWFNRHVFVPHYLGRPTALVLLLRVGAAAAGLVLVLVIRPWVGRAVAGRFAPARRIGDPTRRPRLFAFALMTVAMVLAAVVAAEATLRAFVPRPTGPGYGAWRLGMVRPHPRFGWMAQPSHTTTLAVNGQPYDYAVNAFGFRAADQNDNPDLARPTLVFAGESIAAGIGLPYQRTFAALCGRDLGVQVVNVAEGGYGVDQAYLRLVDVLPRLGRPTAVVMVFVGPQLGRSLQEARPHLTLDGAGELGELVFEPPASGVIRRSRLWRSFHDDLPVLTEGGLRRALAVTRRILLATAAEARGRGTRLVFLVLSLGPPRSLDAHDEAWVIRSLFVDAGLPYLLVDLDVDHVIPHDGHPNAAGARRIADALEARLRNPVGAAPD